MDTTLTTARSLEALAENGLLTGITPALETVAARYAIAATPAMLRLIDPADQEDPIAAQFIPTEAELVTLADELPDPIGDLPNSPVKGIVHRYPDRVLLKPLHACAVYCRFCFRREQVGPGKDVLTAEELDAAIAYIADHSEIWEVILTGGDPLLMSSRRVEEIVARLNAIEHVRVIRLHTRIPVVEPSRITADLVAALKGRAAVYVLLHCNHPRELGDDAIAACARIIDAGIPMLSQSVLLRGVNDDEETLGALMKKFVEHRIKPHYLHHADLAPGTGHFRMPLEKAQALVAGLRGHLSGLCQPTLMLDIPGGVGKVPVGRPFARRENDAWVVENFDGTLHPYRDSTS
jgi:lysine 2,3-aminomutase